LHTEDCTLHGALCIHWILARPSHLATLPNSAHYALVTLQYTGMVGSLMKLSFRPRMTSPLTRLVAVAYCPLRVPTSRVCHWHKDAKTQAVKCIPTGKSSGTTASKRPKPQLYSFPTFVIIIVFIPFIAFLFTAQSNSTSSLCPGPVHGTPFVPSH
jgi:hypothetical protein